MKLNPKVIIQRHLDDLLRAGVRLALHVEQGGDASAVEIRLRDLRPLVNTIKNGESHTAVHVRLYVAVEEEGAGCLDVVPDGNPG